MKTHLIMPMGGAGARFAERGIELPKPLIGINGKPFFFWAAMSIAGFIDSCDITVVTLQDHVDKFGIDREIRRCFPEAEIIVLPSILPGPVFTCIEGIRDIEDDGIVIFNDCDHMFRSDKLNAAVNGGCLEADSALVTFGSAMPQYSYVRYDAEGAVAGTAEKEVVSDRAICGAYVFRNVDIFREAAKKYVDNCPYSECFMSGIYNVLHDEGKSIAAYPVDFHVEFGTPDEYAKAKDSPHFVSFLHQGDQK